MSERRTKIGVHLRVIRSTRKHPAKAIYSLIVPAQSLAGDTEIVKCAQEIRLYRQRPLIILHRFQVISPGGLDGAQDIRWQWLVGIDVTQALCLARRPLKITRLVAF